MPCRSADSDGSSDQVLHDVERGRPVLVAPSTASTRWSSRMAGARHLRSPKSTLRQDPPRSLLVSGEPLVGKRRSCGCLAQRLAADDWSVFEASGADLQADQVYIGQLEGRIRQVVDELAKGAQADLVHPRYRAGRDERPAFGPERHHARPDHAGDRRRPAGRVVRGDRQGHRAAGAAQAVAARPVRNRDARAVVAGGDVVAGARRDRRAG